MALVLKCDMERSGANWDDVYIDIVILCNTPIQYHMIQWFLQDYMCKSKQSLHIASARSIWSFKSILVYLYIFDIKMRYGVNGVITRACVIDYSDIVIIRKWIEYVDLNKSCYTTLYCSHSSIFAQYGVL